MNIQIIKKYMDQWLENKRYEFYDIADKIWANPELGLEEYFAADLLTSVLKKNGFTVFITVLSAVAALAAAAIAVFVYFEKKKKDDEELEHYLDCSIQ